MKSLSRNLINPFFVPSVLMIVVFSSAGLADIPTETVPAPFDVHMLSNMFVEISEAVGPSVVTINTRTTVTTVMPLFPDYSNPYLMNPSENFSSPREQEYTTTSVGSGVIVSENGLILTNHHVAGGADEVEVILQSGEKYSGELIGSDPATDLAIIHIEASGLQAITIGDSDELRIGQWVLAVGSPFSLSQTVTQGIISYLGRSDIGLVDYERYIQTDAAINPGNSGGALVDLDGNLIGINTAITINSRGYQGIGFAIPVNLAVSVMNDLLEYGYVRRGWLGISIQELTPGLSEHFGFDEVTFGVLISQVIADTPAMEYGFQHGDIILTVNKEPFRTVAEFRNMIADIEPGTAVEIGIFREGSDRTIEVVLGEREPDESVDIFYPSASEEYGWVLEELNRGMARSLGDETLRGVLVLEIQLSGRVARAGIQAGDVILEVDGVEVRTISEVDRLIDTSSDTLLLIWRQGYSIYFML
ncbi:MAG: Do family serine endopeptidase [Candidatus Aegiribacteria sp.]|nr:Do family serine endopeptidase [Candidatus Aegiribacteria sp.]